MRIILFFVLFVTYASALAGRDSYSCEIKRAMSLNRNGAVVPASGFLSIAVGKRFAIDRNTGVVLGEVLGNTNALEKRIVSDGTAKNAFRLLSIYGAEADYIYIDPGKKRADKAFLAISRGSAVLSGLCK